MKRHASRLPIAFLLGILAVAPLEARTVRVATFNIQNGPGAPGTTDYEATKAVVARINADVVGFQEVLITNESNWQQIAADLGYSHTTFGTNGTLMSGTQRLGYFSRFPISGTNEITSTNEMTRRPLRVVIDVPGAAKPLVVWNMHHKANEPDAADLAVTNRNNQFRRAIEARRIVEDINTYRAANPTHDEFVMLGDLNDDIFQTNNQAVEITQSEFDTFRTNSQLMPSVYSLRSDVTFPVRYRAFPDDHYGPAGGGMHRLDLRQQNGTSRGTLGSGTLDYIFVSTALRDNPLGAPIGEIYNSQLEATHPGLPKAGAALAGSTSTDASDHFAVFADIEMDDAVPASIVVTPEEEIEFSGPSGGPFAPEVASYTITNPSSQPIEVTVSADVPWLDPDFAGGVAAGEGQIVLNVSVDRAAAPIRPGVYSGRVRITETDTGAAVVRPVRLRVNSTGFDFLTQQFTGTAPFNLANTSVTFTPDGSPSFYRATIRGAVALPVDPAGGTVLSLEDDDFAAVAAPAGGNFTFFGLLYPQVFIGSNGYLTFGSGDTEYEVSPASHFDRPRLSALYVDLNPAARGTVSWRQFPDRLAVTYDNVRRWSTDDSNTFQVEMFFDGRIRITWLRVDAVAPIVGLSPGTGLNAAYEDSVFSAYPSTSAMPLAFEDFVRGYGLDPLGNGAISFDADADGYSNWMEFAFGASPAAPQGSLMSVSGGEGGITFEFLRRLSGFSYVVESSSSLPAGFGPATGINPARATRQTGVPEGWERAAFTVPAEGAGFYRIGASPN